jgi:hypothetical protein
MSSNDSKHNGSRYPTRRTAASGNSSSANNRSASPPHPAAPPARPQRAARAAAAAKPLRVDDDDDDESSSSNGDEDVKVYSLESYSTSKLTNTDLGSVEFNIISHFIDMDKQSFNILTNSSFKVGHFFNNNLFVFNWFNFKGL